MGQTNRFQHGIKVGADSDEPTEIETIKVYTVTYNPADLAANQTTEDTVTVTGLAVGDVPLVVKPTMTAGVGIVNARVSAANTLAITWMNTTAASVNPASEDYTVLVFTPGSD